jgi:hypothetical protein
MQVYRGIFEKIMGLPNFIMLNGMEELFGKFSASIYSKIMIVVDEVQWKKMAPTTINKFKGFVTTKKIRSEEKYEPQRYTDNCSHIVTMTNQEQPCPLEQTKGRRYFPLVADISTKCKNGEINKEDLARYCAMLIGSIEQHIYEIATVLYCWPTHLIDKFACGHGVNNEHLTILEAASKRYTLRNSLTTRWWFTMNQYGTALYDLLRKGSEEMLPSDAVDHLPGNSTDARRVKTTLEHFKHDFVDCYIPIEKKENAYKDLEKVKIWDVQHVSEVLVRHGLLEELAKLKVETEEEMRKRLTAELAESDEGMDNEYRANLLASVYRAGDARMVKVKKADLMKCFESWFKIDQEKRMETAGAEMLTMEKSQAPGMDMLCHNLRVYVPWIFKCKDDTWACIGDVDKCASIVTNYFKAEANVKCSSRKWQHIFDEVFQDDKTLQKDQSQLDTLFSNKFGKDFTFVHIEGKWMMNFMIMLENDDRMLLPFMWPLTEGQKELLCTSENIDWGPVINDFKSAVQITDLNHPLMQKVVAVNRLYHESQNVTPPLMLPNWAKLTGGCWFPRVKQ